MPDLIAAPQVGMASALVGLMQILGNVTGFLLVTLGVTFGIAPLALMAVAIVELVTMISVVYRVGARAAARFEGRPARGSRSRVRRGGPTSCANARTSGSSRRGCSSSWAVRSWSTSPQTYLNQVHGLDEEATASMILVFLVVIAVG